MIEGAFLSIFFISYLIFSDMTVAIPNRALSSGIGTLQYAAPEQRYKKNYNCLVDIYSAGFVIFEAFYPLGDLGDRIRHFEVIRKKEKLPLDFQPALSEYCEKEKAARVTETIESMIKYDPLLRPTGNILVFFKHNERNISSATYSTGKLFPSIRPYRLSKASSRAKRVDRGA